MSVKELITSIILVGSKVHRALGTGLYRDVYGECIVYELLKQGLNVEKRKDMPLKYEELEFESAYEVDMIVEDVLVIGIKPVNIPEDIYYKDIETYVRHSKSSVGLILDFYASDFRSGIRIVEKAVSKPVVFPLSYLKYYYNR